MATHKNSKDGAGTSKKTRVAGALDFHTGESRIPEASESSPEPQTPPLDEVQLPPTPTTPTQEKLPGGEEPVRGNKPPPKREFPAKDKPDKQKAGL